MGGTQKKKAWWRDTTLITMVSLLGVVSVAAFVLHGVDGLREGGENSLFIIRQAAPALFLGFILAGLLTVLFPPRVVGRWMGDEAGVKGVLIGAAAGVLSPGGPYVMYPIAAALMHGGAGIASISAFSVARNIFTANRFLVYELPFLGVPLALAKTLSTLWLIGVGTLLVPVVFRLMPRGAQEAARSRIGASAQERTE
ncbi:MAG: permease [Chloroflexi bacterium]|nr:permease [Chloroflexota bacterium]MYB84755.1 permease [Chloroflexota bacterium]